jgi:hypothetical protein
MQDLHSSGTDQQAGGDNCSRFQLWTFSLFAYAWNTLPGTNQFSFDDRSSPNRATLANRAKSARADVAAASSSAHGIGVPSRDGSG